MLRKDVLMEKYDPGNDDGLNIEIVRFIFFNSKRVSKKNTLFDLGIKFLSILGEC